MNYLSNAFSIQMLDTSVAHTVSITPIEPAQIPSDCVSAIGHADTARVVSTILHRSVPCNRMNVRLTEHDTLYIAQLISGRLPEGSTVRYCGLNSGSFRTSCRRICNVCTEIL